MHPAQESIDTFLRLANEDSDDAQPLLIAAFNLIHRIPDGSMLDDVDLACHKVTGLPIGPDTKINLALVVGYTHALVTL